MSKSKSETIGAIAICTAIVIIISFFCFIPFIVIHDDEKKIKNQPFTEGQPVIIKQTGNKGLLLRKYSEACTIRYPLTTGELVTGTFKYSELEEPEPEEKDK